MWYKLFSIKVLVFLLCGTFVLLLLTGILHISYNQKHWDLETFQSCFCDRFFLLGFSQKNSQNQKATVFKLKYYTYSLKSRKIIICCSKRYRLHTLTDDKRIHFCGQTGQFTVRQADGVHHVQCRAVLRIRSHFRSIRIQPKILIWIWIQTFSLPYIYGMLRRRKMNVYCRMLKKW